MQGFQLSPHYEPRDVEERWYAFWLKQGYFHADAGSFRPAYAIVIPPPNVTGSLHMGHALNNTLQDILCRWQRMRGREVLWVPGTDHAGIATQNVVERQLAAEGASRHELGREAFVRRVWRWREESGGVIIQQLKKLGASCDWERERFTMDEGLSRAVRQVFVRLYEEGLIYRDLYIVNWCPRCQTALSDLEVEYEETIGKLYHVCYPGGEAAQNGIIVATTRPETMFGDTAVAVHPEDTRYAGWMGRSVHLPLTERSIPVIHDAYVNREFGTGALKITPAHDPNDFEIGVRHRLEQVVAIDARGMMTDAAGPYAGMDRFACRKRAVEDLRAQGYLVREEDYRHAVGHCYRCRTVVEPRVSLQWFVRTKGLAAEAIKAVEEGRIRIVPATWAATYFEWMRNIRDWCISRQIWWGHQIPAWTCQACGTVTVALETPQRCACGGEELIQDEDVLDTWFSSALWPFSTMGWPEQTPELKKFYPTTVLVTAFDILFFWVARMAMMGLKFMGDVPFRDVYIHALVRDLEGQKMSKSKGNVIDPLVIIDKYGADAFRFTLAILAAQGRDVKLSEERIEGYRHFANKIWNAARFVLRAIEDDPSGDGGGQAVGQGDLLTGLDRAALEVSDRWILSRLNRLIGVVQTGLEEYKFNDAAAGIYQFFWHEFCDWYIELVKPRLNGENAAAKQTAQAVLAHVLETSLRLLHPFMPFISEELWQQTPHTGDSVSLAPFPTSEERWLDGEAEAEMELLMGVISGIRNVRSEFNVKPALVLPRVVISCDTPGGLAALRRAAEPIKTLARIETLDLGEHLPRPGTCGTAVVGRVEAFVPFEGLINIEEEAARLQKELRKVDQEIAQLDRKLANQEFISKAPAEIIEKNEARRDVLAAQQTKLAKNLAELLPEQLSKG
ncbi:MAG: valine--tRNA ligase [Candidatus Tectomicrobia bacterium]|nr:valine--tRNA ligase [Candidatus Tectomicrobia bacterium]